LANNIVLNAGSGGSTLATEQNGTSEQYQKIKITDGTGGAFTNMAAVTSGSALKVDASGAAVPITDNSGSLTVDFNAASALPAGTNVIGHVITDSGSTTVVTGTTTISGAVTEASLDAALVAAETASSGLKGLTAMGATTTAHPTYTTADTDPLSLDTLGNLRVSLKDSPANTNKFLTTPDLPSGASTAAKQPALGTAGSASSDVITVQGIASMTKLLVTPDSVALPAHQSTNIDQIAGTTPDVNSGAKSAGTLRVVLATDQPALTNKLLVTPDSVALPANQSVNVAQVNGVTTLMGAGATGTGSQRVTPASGSSMDAALGTAATNAYSVAPTAVTTGGFLFNSIVTANSNNKTQVKATAGQVYKIEVYSIDSAPQYVKVFNKTSANVTAGTTACDWQIMVPANATAANGAGVTSSYEIGCAMGTAITIMVTAGIGVSDNTSVPATKSIVNVFYL